MILSHTFFKDYVHCFQSSLKVEVENAKTTNLALKKLQVEIKELQEEEKRLRSVIDKEKKENEVKSYACKQITFFMTAEETTAIL